MVIRSTSLEIWCSVVRHLVVAIFLLIWVGLNPKTVCAAQQSIFTSPSRDFRVQDAETNSSDSLRRLIADILEAIDRKDSAREQRLIRSLIIPKSDSWFVLNFDSNTAGLLRSEYDRSMQDFERTTQRLLETNARGGPVAIHVNRYTDPIQAPEPFPAMLRSMRGQVALYELSLTGERPSFQIALSPTGGPGKVVAGDLDGYFVETAQGFRFIPSAILTLAVQEDAKTKTEVLATDSDGRPELVRMDGRALAGMIAEHVFPSYPKAAREKHIEGTVVMSVRIGKDGRVREVTVKSGLPELQMAATGALKKWRFKPVKIDGYRVEVQADIESNFNLRQNPK